MSLNDNLRRAKRQKNDEFYTQRSDIESELRHYEGHFLGKVVYCNCDDPRVSNFFHYFGVRPSRWTVSDRDFDRGAMMLILELCRAQIAQGRVQPADVVDVDEPR